MYKWSSGEKSAGMCSYRNFLNSGPIRLTPKTSLHLESLCAIKFQQYGECLLSHRRAALMRDWCLSGLCVHALRWARSRLAGTVSTALLASHHGPCQMVKAAGCARSFDLSKAPDVGQQRERGCAGTVSVIELMESFACSCHERVRLRDSNQPGKHERRGAKTHPSFHTCSLSRCHFSLHTGYTFAES